MGKDQKSDKKQRKTRFAAAGWKRNGFGTILGSFWKPLGPFWEPRGLPEISEIVVVSSGACKGSFWASWVAMGPPRPARGVPKPLPRRDGGGTWALGNFAKTEPGASNHLVFFG